MCEFCHQHGEGKKWYLQAKNYSEDLLADTRRRKFLRRFFSEPEHLAGVGQQLERLQRAPRLIRGVARRLATRKAKRWHFGQVLPIEDVEKVFGFVNSIVRTPCVCRYATLGERARYCYGVTLNPAAPQWQHLFDGLDTSFFSGPDASAHEQLSKEEALQSLTEHEKEGLCHTVWTFKTPFVGGICNCDRADCLAMRATVGHGVKIMFRAEYVAEVSPDACTGCRACMRVCQFGALGYSAATRKACIDPRACYGCGVCRAACPKHAIGLRPRAEVAAAAKQW
jgi:ferredoxin